MKELFIPGIPRPQGSKTAYTRGGRVFLRDMANKRTVKHGVESLTRWKEDVARLARREFDGELLEGPVGLRASFAFSRPNTHLKKNGEIREPFRNKVPRGDLDKYLRAIGDALTKVAYKDDNQVTYVETTKQYTDQSDHGPGVWLKVWSA